MGQEAARGRQVVGAKGLITQEGEPDLGRAPPLIQDLIDSSMTEYKTGLLREKEGSVLAARVEEVALEVEEGGRVPVEREVGDIQVETAITCNEDLVLHTNRLATWTPPCWSLNQMSNLLLVESPQLEKR